MAKNLSLSLLSSSPHTLTIVFLGPVFPEKGGDSKLVYKERLVRPVSSG